MTTSHYAHPVGAPEWSDEVIAEAVQRPCPFCGVQPPENCHGDDLAEFTEWNGHVIKLHAPRLRQVPAFRTPHAAH